MLKYGVLRRFPSSSLWSCWNLSRWAVRLASGINRRVARSEKRWAVDIPPELSWCFKIARYAERAVKNWEITWKFPGLMVHWIASSAQASLTWWVSSRLDLMEGRDWRRWTFLVVELQGLFQVGVSNQKVGWCENWDVTPLVEYWRWRISVGVRHNHCRGWIDVLRVKVKRRFKDIRWMSRWVGKFTWVECIVRWFWFSDSWIVTFHTTVFGGSKFEWWC